MGAEPVRTSRGVWPAWPWAGPANCGHEPPPSASMSPLLILIFTSESACLWVLTPSFHGQLDTSALYSHFPVHSQAPSSRKDPVMRGTAGLSPLLCPAQSGRQLAGAGPLHPDLSDALSTHQMRNSGSTATSEHLQPPPGTQSSRATQPHCKAGHPGPDHCTCCPESQQHLSSPLPPHLGTWRPPTVQPHGRQGAQESCLLRPELWRYFLSVGGTRWGLGSWPRRCRSDLSTPGTHQLSTAPEPTEAASCPAG